MYKKVPYLSSVASNRTFGLNQLIRKRRIVSKCLLKLLKIQNQENQKKRSVNFVDAINFGMTRKWLNWTSVASNEIFQAVTTNTDNKEIGGFC